MAKAKRRLLRLATELTAALGEAPGEPAAEALFGELLPAASIFDEWLRSIEDRLSPMELDLPSRLGAKSGRTLRAPRGLIALVTPSRSPVALPLRTIVPALLAGNAVVWKPSPSAMRASALVLSAFDGLLPEGLFSIVEGGAEAGRELLAARPDWVIFAGRSETGRAVLTACAEGLTPASLELGGMDAAVVLEDARLDRAARGILWAASQRSGDAIRRVYVARSVAPKLTARLEELASSEAHARSYGAIRIATPSAGDEPLEPPRGAAEPELAVVAVEGLEEAAARVRASRYALTTSVWTASLERASDLALLVGTPVVSFNCHGVASRVAGAPWGGSGESGFGVTSGPSALEALTCPLFVLEDRSSRARDLDWAPYSPALVTAGSSLVKLQGGASFFGRVPAFFSLLLALVKRFFEG